ncbi:hypothetical protein MHZ95_16690 [Sporosarcina sp. ACRSM]|uniref:hypothetical protein n=1 Tax=Sporosarcina sp. ACRSM TaxID=2918216 RepID=UPI001EF5DF8A|nr:hypothetical protein [Sporosarcina sp. ACRSM]MCG7336899.1 hypothetical protein [Sporosarcina sp. ACRSM]
MQKNITEEAEKIDSDFTAEAISLNMCTRPIYLILCSGFITFLFSISHGWHSLTQFFLFITVLSIAFFFWFPYSKFVKRQVAITKVTVDIGSHCLFPREIDYVVCRANGNMFEFHLHRSNEATQIRMEDEWKTATRDRLKQWCEKFDIRFVEK